MRLVDMLQGGGPGSGCKGDNCGRPKSAFRGDKGRRIKGPTPANPGRTTAGIPIPKTVKKPGGTPGALKVKSKDLENLTRPLNKMHRDSKLKDYKITTDPKGMKQWKDNLPTTTKERQFSVTRQRFETVEHQKKVEQTTLLPKDIAKLTKPIEVWNPHTGDIEELKPGAKVSVIRLEEKIGDNPRTIHIRTPYGEADAVSEDKLTLDRRHPDNRSAGPYQPYPMQPAPPSKQQIQKQYETPGGAKYTILKPSSPGRPAKDKDWKEGQPNPNRHRDYGKFSAMRTRSGKEALDIHQLDVAQKGPSSKMTSVIESWRTGGKGAGTTLLVTRDPKTKTGQVMEFERGEHGHLKSGTTVASFKNLGHMNSYLSRRYGVKLKLPKKG
jgi:hypothetical protein